MSLVGLGGAPLVAIGSGGVGGTAAIMSSTNIGTLNAANAAFMFIGQIFTEDGGSHTIDTSGASSLGWLAGSGTFSNAASRVKVGLAAVDTANGPPARAVNSAGAITFDVSKTLSGGGGGISASAWNEHAPDAGSKTIAHGDLVCFAIQMTVLGGSDFVLVGGANSPFGVTSTFPAETSFNGVSSYSGRPNTVNATITFSDGTLGFFYGGYVFSTLTSATWNNTSALKEYGNFLQMPFPATVYGLVVNSVIGADADYVLYSDPLGTPVAQRTCSVAGKTSAATKDGMFNLMFASPYQAAANQPLAAIIKPTTSTNGSAAYRSFANANHQKSEQLGANCYAINRNTGAFAAQNSNKDRFGLGLLIGAFDVGGTGKLSRAGLHPIEQGIAA